jgi:hypothetical protein
MLAENAQYMGEEFIVETFVEEEQEEVQNIEDVDLDDGADDFSEDEEMFEGEQQVNLANLLNRGQREPTPALAGFELLESKLVTGIDQE